MTRKMKMGIAAGIVALAVGIGVVWRLVRPEPVPDTVKSERGTVTQDVIFTGQLSAEQTAVLGFESIGTFIALAVEVGDIVEEGYPLARLDARIADLDVTQAQSDRVSTQAERNISWQKAETDWQNTKEENVRTIEQKKQVVRDAKDELDQAKEVWQQAVREDGDEATTTRARYAAVLDAQTAYHAAQQALQTTLETAEKSNQSARAAADLAKAQYEATLQTGPGVAGLSALEASEAIAHLRLAKNTLTAPFAGVITAIDYEVGEVVTAGSPVVTVETIDQLEIEADVPETDAAKMTVGQTAQVTFDAFPLAEEWQAEVVFIAPSAKVVEGVPTYEVKLRVLQADERLKPGLTANVEVQTAQRDNVIIIPRRAMITRDGRRYVRVLQTDGTVTEQEIEVGLLGSDGSIEVVSGLSGGENIVVDTQSG